MTFRERLNNFWYYYKKHTIAAAVCAALIIILAVQCTTSEQYDYSVVIYMAKPISETVTDVISGQLARFGEDINGDGRVAVEILNCTYGDNDNVRMNQIAKLQAILSMPQSQLFIVDEACFKNLDEMGLFDSPEILTDKEGKALSLAGSKMELEITRQVGKYMPAEFYICKRRVEGTAIDGKEKADEYHNMAMNMLEKLCADYS